MNNAFVKAALACAVSATMLSGCAGIVVAGLVGGTTLVATDRRTTGMVINDKIFQQKAEFEIQKVVPAYPATHVDVTSYNGRLLIVGEVPTESDKQNATNAARSVPDVIAVYNELTVGTPLDSQAIAGDALLLSKVKAAIVETQGVWSHSVKAVVNNKAVYLMGLLTEEEAGKAAAAASKVEGVAKVVRCFQIEPASKFQ